MTSYLLILVTSQCVLQAHTELTFTSDPHNVKSYISKYLHIRCGLDDLPDPSVTSDPSTTPAGLVGRALKTPDDGEGGHAQLPSSRVYDRTSISNKYKRSSLSKDAIRHVASMTISRDGVPIAAVSTFTPARLESHLDTPNSHVTGDVTHVTSGQLGYLDVTWSFPTDVQVGSYTCDVTAITESGHVLTLSKSLEVDKSFVDIDDILGAVRDVIELGVKQNITLREQGQLIDRLESTVEKQKATIATLETSLGNTTMQQQTTVNLQKAQLSDQQSTIDNLQASVSKHESTIKQQQSTILRLETEFSQQQTDISDQKTALQTLKNTLAKLQNVTDFPQLQSDMITLKSDVTDIKHTETGLLWCGDSQTWSTSGKDQYYHGFGYYHREKDLSVHFLRPYAAPPIVFLSVSHLFTHDITFYGVQILSVNTTGFTVRCGGNDDASNHQIIDMEVSWLAVSSF